MAAIQTLNKLVIQTWCILLLLCGSTVHAQHESVYDLPSFSLLLKVSKADKALVVFQDHLENAIHEHLVDFFGGKVQIPSFGNGLVDEVSLTSNLVWKQLTPADANGITEYEVRSDFDCKLTVAFETAENSAARLSKSIMDLFLIESFQGDNYWHLVHNFLSDEMLEGITDVKITVISDGFIAYNGEQPNDAVIYEDEGGWTGAMTFGVVFASFFFFILVLMWVYMCFFVQGTLLFKSHNPYIDDLSKATCTEDLNCSENSIDFNHEDNESRWMDAWANSITSIRLREPVKIRKRMRDAARRPAQTHRSQLDSINESNSEDECSLASKDDIGQRREALRIMRQQQRALDECSVASIDEEAKRELEELEKEKGSSTQALVPFEPDGRALVVAKPRTLALQKPKFDLRKAFSDFNFMRSQPQLDQQLDPPQLEKLDEMC